MLLSTTRPFNSIDPFISPTPTNAFYLPGTPQITTSGAITDTTNWVLVSGTYLAGGEEWLTIGNFNPIGQTALDTFYNANDFAVSSYYYIDNVFVIPMEGGGLLPQDTAICTASFPLQLSAFPGFTGYEWDNGDTAMTKAIPAPGTYAIRANYAGCQILDTITITALPPPVLNLAPVQFCESALPVGYTLPDSLGFELYTWPDGSTGQNFTIREAGEITVLGTGDCGSGTGSLTVMVDAPLTVDLGPDISICFDGGLQDVILSSTSPLPNYFWSTGEFSPEITAGLPGTYSLLSENACGSFQDEVALSGCEPRVYVPTVFSPGSLYDANAFFRPFASHADILSLEVFDRWGSMVYYGEGSAAAWDGRHGSRECSQGVYAYLVRYAAENGDTQILHGGVLLLR
ncbi:MAG: gliding motility-associated C-terminal domain-containing protein [Saprospiraceae bacterium]|nr:gliding motility-associated C-terminal domain-containing protein [Saprospiraceae bacterium]